MLSSLVLTVPGNQELIYALGRYEKNAEKINLSRPFVVPAGP